MEIERGRESCFNCFIVDLNVYSVYNDNYKEIVDIKTSYLRKQIPYNQIQ